MLDIAERKNKLRRRTRDLYERCQKNSYNDAVCAVLTGGVANVFAWTGDTSFAILFCLYSAFSGVMFNIGQKQMARVWEMLDSEIIN